MTTMASQITCLTVVYSTVYSDADQRKHQSSASLAFVWGIHRDRWIPRTNGHLRGKCFHLMTSSWWGTVMQGPYNKPQQNTKCACVSGHELSQWKKTVQCNVVPHWLNPHPGWHLCIWDVLHIDWMQIKIPRMIFPTIIMMMLWSLHKVFWSPRVNIGKRSKSWGTYIYLKYMTFHDRKIRKIALLVYHHHRNIFATLAFKQNVLDILNSANNI